MKTGAIVYVASGEKNGNDFDIEEAVRCLNLKVDRVELVAPRAGHFEVADAWWLLTAKGMQKIVCMLAEVSEDFELTLTGRELRLCG